MEYLCDYVINEHDLKVHRAHERAAARLADPTGSGARLSPGRQESSSRRIEKSRLRRRVVQVRHRSIIFFGEYFRSSAHRTGARRAR